MIPITAGPPLTRKDISCLLGHRISPRQIGRNEERWGLARARMRLNTRMVLYRRQAALAVLQNLGAEVQ